MLDNHQTYTALVSDEGYDVIIVGARVAGATTAALLAERGARVLLLDRVTFPAPTVSSPVFFGNSMAVFERIGVLQDIEALGAPRIRYYGGRTPDINLVSSLPPSHGRDYAYSIQRDRLDTAVLQRVRTYPGITVREGFNVTSLVWGAGRVVGVRGRQQGGSEEVIYGRAVVGADGKRSLVARETEAPIYARLPGRFCHFYTYYHNVEPIDQPSAIVYADPETQNAVLVFDSDMGLTAIATSVAAHRFPEVRKDPEGALESIWRSLPDVAHRARNATRATPVMGQAPVDSFFRRSYGPGWALVGDAGHYIDPNTGQGINNAVHSAELFADAWAQTQQRASWLSAMAQYQRRRDAACRPMFDLIGFGARMEKASKLGINIGEPLFRAIARRPEVRQRYIGMYNGVTPVNEFMHPLNLAAIFLEDQVRYALPQQAARAFQRSLLVRPT